MKENTVQHILETAQELVRQRGYSAFSYADIAERVGIRKASIHYHFPTKDDLVKALVRRYRDEFGRKRRQIQQTADSADQQLLQFARLYGEGLSQGQLCLCGMLAADFAVLPEVVLAEVQEFFTENEEWLVQVLEQGCQAGQLQCQSPAGAEAKRLLATLQGAQFIARVAADGPAAFEQILVPLLASVGCKG